MKWTVFHNRGDSIISNKLKLVPWPATQEVKRTKPQVPRAPKTQNVRLAERPPFAPNRDKSIRLHVHGRLKAEIERKMKTKPSKVAVFSLALLSFIKLVQFWFSVIVKAGYHYRRSRSRSHKTAYDLVKIENRSRKQRHKLDGIGVGRIRTFPFLPIPFTTPSLIILWKLGCRSRK